MESDPKILPYRRANLPVEARVADLLARMTLEEKLDQLHQCNVTDNNPNNLSNYADELRPTYGSFIVGGTRLLEVRNALQHRAVNETRLGIPALFGADVIHGFRAILPIPLAQACTWDPELVRRGCALAAAESRAQGIDWTFAPMVDHCVDPRWGRIAETFGESPYAAGVFAVASVRGYQGEHPGAPGTVAACLKHYVGYGASEGGRDYSYTEISPPTLWSMHLPPFEAGVRAGALSVMSAFNDLNGVPTGANPYTLTEILRTRWGFKGLVVSDWGAVRQLMLQGFAADGAEAAQKAISSGVDIDMADGLYRQHIPALIEAKRLSPAVVDEAVRRVLRVKFQLGLFERPMTEASVLTDAPPNPAQLELAEEVAAQAIVLLKNDGVLPLASGAKRVALIGPLGQANAALLGSWAQQGRADETPTLLAELRKRLPAGVELEAALGCSTFDLKIDEISAAVTLAQKSDVVVLCLGEEAWMSGENASRTTLRLAGRQEELARAIAATGKPVALVLVSGRPIEIESFEPAMNAVVAAWQGGSRAAAALADVLVGRRNPAGRLAVTWPRTTGQIPIFHNMRPRARAGDEGAYRDIPTTPLYPFGHGMAYTTFSCSPIRLDRAEVHFDGTITAEVTVTNTGSREGAETVFWFIRDPAASITRPLRELKYFEKALLPAGASRVFRFGIHPARDLAFPNGDGKPILEPGVIELFASGQTTEFRVVE